MGTFRIAPGMVSNATKRLSGDRKKYPALSVPASGSALSESTRRVQSCVRPLLSALKTMVRPSGVICAQLKKLGAGSGGDTEKRETPAGAAVRVGSSNAATAAI